MTHRIEPAARPYEKDMEATLEKLMPPGVEPLVLFRTLARNPRVFRRFMAGGLLDKGSITLREREIAIDRACARCGGEYEWGVHIALFAEKAGFGADEIAATVAPGADAACWTPRERLIVRLVDELHETHTVGDGVMGCAEGGIRGRAADRTRRPHRPLSHGLVHGECVAPAARGLCGALSGRLKGNHKEKGASCAMRPSEFRGTASCLSRDQNNPMVMAPTNRNASPVARYPALHRQHFSLHSLGEEDSRAEGARFASGFMAALQHGTGRVRRDFPNPLSPAGKCCVDEILSVPSEGHMTGVFSRFPVRLCIYHFGRVDQARNRMTGLPMLARSSRRCSTAGASSSG